MHAYTRPDLLTKRTRVRVLYCMKQSAMLFTLRSLSCVNEYLAIDSGGYLYKQPSRNKYSMAGCFLEQLTRRLIE